MRPAGLGAALTAVLAVLVLQAVAVPVGYVPVPPVPTVIPPGPPGPPSTGASLALVTVWESLHIDFGFEGRTYFVIQRVEEWRTLWNGIRMNPAPSPEVDFATQTVIVALFGVANTGGFGIRIHDVVRGDDGTVRVLAEASIPGFNCYVTEAFTYPVHMVSIPKSYGPFAVEETSTVYSCE